jgi:hypothetical protein
MKKVNLIPTIEVFRVSDGQRVIINDSDSIDGRQFTMEKPDSEVQSMDEDEKPLTSKQKA